MRFYIIAEPRLFHYEYYSIEAAAREEARDKFFKYLDSTINTSIFPDKDYIETTKLNTSISIYPHSDSEYKHLNDKIYISQLPIESINLNMRVKSYSGNIGKVVWNNYTADKPASNVVENGIIIHWDNGGNICLPHNELLLIEVL